MKKQHLLLITLICLLATGCQKNNEEPSATYDEGVEINGVVWATRNVGLPGTFVESDEDIGLIYMWNSRVGWKWVTGEVKTSDGSRGQMNLYPNNTWTKENDPCPAGWHIPTKNDAATLIAYVDPIHCTPPRGDCQDIDLFPGAVRENFRSLIMQASYLASTGENLSVWVTDEQSIIVTPHGDGSTSYDSSGQPGEWTTKEYFAFGRYSTMWPYSIMIPVVM